MKSMRSMVFAATLIALMPASSFAGKKEPDPCNLCCSESNALSLLLQKDSHAVRPLVATGVRYFISAGLIGGGSALTYVGVPEIGGPMIAGGVALCCVPCCCQGIHVCCNIVDPLDSDDESDD